MFIRRIVVGDRTRVLVIRKGRFERILDPGVYWIWTVPGPVEFETRELKEIVFESAWADYVIKERPEIAARYFTMVETTDAQVAVVYFDRKLARVIGPGRRVLFWKGPVTVTSDLIDVKASPDVPAELVLTLARLGALNPAASPTTTGATFSQVEDGRTGLLYVAGRFVRAMEPGTYGFWNAAGAPRVEIVDLRWQTLEANGQEILTKDKVSLRVNVWAEYRVADAVKAKQAVKDYAEFLYRAVQLAVRQTLGRRTLEEILAEKVDIDESVAATVRKEAEAVGVFLGAMAIKDIILPGEVREILNQVVTAEKQAQANLIRRREETAATRALLNTAKLMEDNPLLVRLKELETLEKIAEKVDKITVGSFDSLLSSLVTMRSEK